MGLFQGALGLLCKADVCAPPASASPPDTIEAVVPRIRGSLQVPNLTTNDGICELLEDTVFDPGRFRFIPDGYVWTIDVTLPIKEWPSQKQAANIAAERLKGRTHEQLATAFGFSLPTIRKSLKLAEAEFRALRERPRKMARARWHEDHAAEVSEAAKTMRLGELAQHFRKSGPTIKKALEFFALRSKAGVDSEPALPDGGQPRTDAA